MLNMVIVGTNLVVGGILVVGVLFMSLKKKSPCAIIYFGGVTLGFFFTLRIIWLGIIPNFRLLLLFIVLFWLVIALMLMVVDYLLCGIEL